jgi:hypothetical protein
MVNARLESMGLISGIAATRGAVVVSQSVVEPPRRRAGTFERASGGRPPPFRLVIS